MDDIITVIKGTELKLRLEVIMGDYAFMDCDFSVKAYTSNGPSVTILKNKCITIEGEDTACFLPIDTSLLNTGVLILDIRLNIPDDDYTSPIDDGYRTEIYRKRTNIKIIE